MQRGEVYAFVRDGELVIALPQGVTEEEKKIALTPEQFNNMLEEFI